MKTSQARTIASGTWSVDPAATEASFTVSNFLFRRVVGTIAVRWGSVCVDADGRPTGVSASLKTASFHTDNAKRDTDICSARFLDAPRHPDLAFVSRDIRPTDDGWQVGGRLTLGSSAAPVDLSVQVVHVDDGGNHRLTATARGVVDRAVLGVRAPSFLIGREVEIHITATLHLDA